jgi:hypothetical protein
MATNRKIASRIISAEEREFEELLRRAALYASAQNSKTLSSKGVRVLAPRSSSRPRKAAFDRVPLA